VKYFFMFRSVFIADTGKEVFVWIGKRASEGENKNGLTYAHVSCRGACTGFAGWRDAPKIQVGFGILREILAGSGILFHRGKWD
jgi:hypothetical protein